jgi:hypothetical protein
VAFIPFKLDGRKLGSVNKVVLLREAPKRISSVELEIKLRDSTLARGLAGCHLAAHFDAQHNPGGIRINADPFSRGVFSCLDSDSVPQFQVFGRAVFQPGAVSVPLLLPNDIVDELKQGHLGPPNKDSIATAAGARADSIAEAADARADSISTVAEAHADSIVARSERLVDSLQKEGMRRADSTRRAVGRMADSIRNR